MPWYVGFSQPFFTQLPQRRMAPPGDVDGSSYRTLPPFQVAYYDTKYTVLLLSPESVHENGMAESNDTSLSITASFH